MWGLPEDHGLGSWEDRDPRDGLQEGQQHPKGRGDGAQGVMKPAVPVLQLLSEPGRAGRGWRLGHLQHPPVPWAWGSPEGKPGRLRDGGCGMEPVGWGGCAMGSLQDGGPEQWAHSQAGLSWRPARLQHGWGRKHGLGLSLSRPQRGLEGSSGPIRAH